jgi:hypothetical protein
LSQNRSTRGVLITGIPREGGEIVESEHKHSVLPPRNHHVCLIVMPSTGVSSGRSCVTVVMAHTLQALRLHETVKKAEDEVSRKYSDLLSGLEKKSLEMLDEQVPLRSVFLGLKMYTKPSHPGAKIAAPVCNCCSCKGRSSMPSMHDAHDLPVP